MFKHFVKSFISWRFRKRSPFLISFTASATILAATLGIGNLAGTVQFQDITLKLAHSDSIAFNVFNALVILLLFVLVASFIMLIIEFVLIKFQGSKKKIIVIEGRGLRDDDGISLADSIGDNFPKSRVPYMLDLRQRLDGKIVDPKALIPRIAVAKELINQTRTGNGREQTQIAYGGLTAVPLTFLTGVEFDDEGSISVFDWDRSCQRWRPLDDLDDGLRLSNPDLNNLSDTESVVLAISVSYPIESDSLSTSFTMPVVRMTIDGMSSNSHWSADKQAALADQFFESAKKLSAVGVKHIHLVLAAPNSVVFNFGRRYDKRNLPELTVYQYERSQEIKYPWGVRMPVGGTTTAFVERTCPT